MKEHELSNLTENKLILLFILDNIEFPITNVQITEIIMQDGLMNYFFLQQYLSDLVNTNHIKNYTKDDKQFYKITKKGEETLTFFENRISITAKESVLKTIESKRKDFKESTEIISDYIPLNKNEYIVDCKIIENNTPLIELKLTVGTKAQAKSMCELWKKNPQSIYAQIISVFN